MTDKTGKVVCVVGPTASGKTALSVELARTLNGEIVSCDSMQIYKEMNIGTAKPSVDEMQGIPHHMISIISPCENYSAARYVKEASCVVDDVLSRGKTPIIVGGTGMYVDSLIAGTEFAEYKENGEYREKLFALCDEKGGQYIYDMLKAVDPERAAQIHKNNVKRVIRALEVYEATGKTITEHDNETKKKPLRYDARYIGLMFEDRDKLYARINSRVDKMIEDGLENEVRHILNLGVPKTATSMQAIGYRELVEYIEGKCGLSDAVSAIKQNSRRYAKRQMTWFKRNKSIDWLCVDKAENISDLLQASINFISSKGI